MDEFIIEKYIEIIKRISIMYKFMLIQILTLLVFTRQFVIEKYIEIIKDISIMYEFMLIQILTLLVFTRQWKDRELVTLARGYREHK